MHNRMVGYVKISWTLPTQSDSINFTQTQLDSHNHLLTKLVDQMATSKDLRFKTIDGLSLGATLFSVGDKKPCIIMSSGVS